jgi:hypothetical protein
MTQDVRKREDVFYCPWCGRMTRSSRTFIVERAKRICKKTY